MVTIKDVAVRAAVGLGTASRALSGSSQVSMDTRARVMAAARELGYVPHGPARSLRRARTDILGLILADVRNPFFADLAHAVEEEARRHGKTVLLANTDEDPERESSYLRAFAAQRIDGLLVAPHGSDDAPFRPLEEAGFPLVFLDRFIPTMAAPVIAADNAGGVRAGLQWLVDRGHTRIAYVGGPRKVSSAAERLDAFCALRGDLGLDSDKRLIAEGDFRVASGGDAARQILALSPPPDAFLIADGLMTMGVLREMRIALGRASAAIPLVSFDDAPWFDLADHPITAIVNDATEIGRRGVKALQALMNGEEVTSSRVPTRLVER